MGGHMLKMEADFRLVLVCTNSMHTHLIDEASQNKRAQMFPHFGYLYPEGYEKLRKATDFAQMETGLEATDCTNVYKKCFEKAKTFYEEGGDSKGQQSIEDLMYAENVKAYELAF